MKRKYSIDLFIKPGLLNFFILLAIWYLLIAFYTITADPAASLTELYLFYSKYSWPNFLVSYLLFIFVIPFFLKRKKYNALLFATLGTILLFVVIRYFNNVHWDPEYYYTTGRDKKVFLESPKAIFVQEFIRVFQFTIVSFAFRIYVEWRINEENKSKLENEKIKSELQSLRYQINPHFLLNSLNNIYYLSLIKSDKAPSAIMKISEMLRYILYEKKDFVFLRTEIEYIKSYLDFHMLRFPLDVIDLKIVISETEADELVPPLIFIAFLENVFKHGKAGTSENPTKIDIDIIEGFLTYSVQNIIEKERELSESGGSGLDNLKKRLELIYGDNFTLNTTLRDNTYFAVLKIPMQL